MSVDTKAVGNHNVKAGDTTADVPGALGLSRSQRRLVMSDGAKWRGITSYANPDNAGLAGTALANSTTLTDVSAATQHTFLANTAGVGSLIRVTASGTFSNTGTPTLLLGVYWGGVAGTALAVSGAITTITAATTWQWRIEWQGIFRTIGATGTIWGQGRLEMPASLTQFQAAYALPAATNAAVTVDTTADQTITIGAQWGTANASNTLLCNNFVVETLH